MTRWLRNLAWRLTPDDALSRYSFGTKPSVGVYSYEKAIAGKRRSEARETARRKAESLEARKAKPNVTPIRKVSNG